MVRLCVFFKEILVTEEDLCLKFLGYDQACVFLQRNPLLWEKIFEILGYDQVDSSSYVFSLKRPLPWKEMIYLRGLLRIEVIRRLKERNVRIIRSDEEMDLLDDTQV